MRFASGVSLAEKWKDMDAVQQMWCVTSVADLVKQMTELRFPAYGSIYFANAPIDARLEFADGFCIGPHCGTRYWPCSPGEVRFYQSKRPNRGPCKLFPIFGLRLLRTFKCRARPRIILFGSVRRRILENPWTGYETALLRYPRTTTFVADWRRSDWEIDRNGDYPEPIRAGLDSPRSSQEKPFRVMRRPDKNNCRDRLAIFRYRADLLLRERNARSGRLRSVALA